MGSIPALALYFFPLLLASDPFILFAIFSHRVESPMASTADQYCHLLLVCSHAAVAEDDDDARFNRTMSEKCPIHQVIIYEIICLPMTMHHSIYFSLSFRMCGCEREPYGRLSLANDICDFYLNGATSHSPPERFVHEKDKIEQRRWMKCVGREIHRSTRSYVERAVFCGEAFNLIIIIIIGLCK